MAVSTCSPDASQLLAAIAAVNDKPYGRRERKRFPDRRSLVGARMMWVGNGRMGAAGLNKRIPPERKTAAEDMMPLDAIV